MGNVSLFVNKCKEILGEKWWLKKLLNR
jgi:hypothetical protein